MNFKSLIDTLCEEKTETEWIEFKKNYSNPQSIGEYISALSNSACLCEEEYGYLIYGIENKTHKIIGTGFSPKSAKGKGNEGLEPWLTRLLSPRIDFKITEYNYNNKHLVIFKIDATKNTPITFRGSAYIRVGEHKHKLSEHPEKERKIWNLKYRYILTNTLFPTEVFTYEPWVIREALHNCVAHQDYELSGRIIITEESDSLEFSNLGSFLPGNIENVILQNFPLETLRNRFLANAMVNLNMIDIIGSGINRMFTLQKDRFFPLPDYEIFKQRVKVTIPGKIIDENYTKLLIQKTDLDIWKVFLLDRIQKKKQISKEEHQTLKNEGLVEGRYPNLFISQKIAKATEQKVKYTISKAFDDKYYNDLIINFLKQHKTATKEELDELLINKLSDVLSAKQKKIKIQNLKSRMIKDGFIKNIGSRKNPIWKLKKINKN